MIEFKCGKCGAAMEAPDSQEGQVETCPRCGAPNVPYRRLSAGKRRKASAEEWELNIFGVLSFPVGFLLILDGLGGNSAHFLGGVALLDATFLFFGLARGIGYLREIADNTRGGTGDRQAQPISRRPPC